VKYRHDQAGFAILSVTLASGPAPLPARSPPARLPLAVAALAALAAWVLSF
jgi:hypothetical protein